MRHQSRPARPRTRAVIVAVLILLGVLGSVGVAQAAGGGDGKGGGKDGGTVCADGRRDTNPADGVCARDGGPKKDDGAKKGGDKKGGDKNGDKKDGDKKDGDKGGEKGKSAPPRDPNLVAGTPCTKAAEACADLNAKKAWLIRDGKVTRGPVPLASGGPGYETPRGDFKVQWKNKDHRSAEFDNAPMPWAVFFTDTGVAFHQGDLRSNSHGCIRLGAQDAEAFFNALNTGDDVQVR